MATIQEIIEYSKANPESDYAKAAYEHITSGEFDEQAAKEGVDLSWAGRPKLEPKIKKEPLNYNTGMTPGMNLANAAATKVKQAAPAIADVTGGKEIAQGLGQALAQGKTNKALDQAQSQGIDIQTQLLQRIKEKKAKGEDTSRLEGALQDLGGSIQAEGESREEMLNPEGLTNKEVLGDALQLGATVAGGKIAGGASKLVGKGTGLAAGALKGAATGVIAGTAEGALQGTAQGLQKNKDAKGVAKDAITGGVLGLAGGAVLGGIAGGISGKIDANKIKKEGFIKDLVSPKATTAIKEQAIKEGRVTDPGILTKSKILPSKRDEKLAEAVEGFVSPNKSVTQNVDSIKTEVSRINTGVKDYVKANKVPFNTNQLKTKLNGGKGELKVIFASDQNAEKTYNAVVKEFMKHVKSKDTAGLLDARQEFDKIPAIRKLLDSQGLGENVKKEIVLTARMKANEYIAELLPKGNKYRADLLKESRMIEAIGNIAEKNTGMIDKNKLQLLVNEYPILKWVAGGLVGAAGVGVGGALIGSTD